MKASIQTDLRRYEFEITSSTFVKNNFSQFNKYLISLFQSSKCEKPYCSSRWYETRGKLLQKQTKWNTEYGWCRCKCRKCLVNHFKPYDGNSSCMACPIYTLSNEANTKCYDPYKNIFLVKNLTYVFWVALSINNVA